MVPYSVALKGAGLDCSLARCCSERAELETHLAVDKKVATRRRLDEECMVRGGYVESCDGDEMNTTRDCEKENCVVYEDELIETAWKSRSFIDIHG